MLVLFNKPYGTFCQFSGEGNQSTLANFINIPNIYAAGRLDKDSEGLLVLTDDGKLQNKIANPKFKLEKTYWAQVEGETDDLFVQKIKQGVELRDGLCLPADAKRISEPIDIWPRTPPIRYRKHIPSSWVQITLKEGRNRQVRRMTAACGFPTLRLIRVQIGEWMLEGLKPGQWKIIA